MPVVKLSGEKLALVRVLVEAKWTHARIAEVFGVTRAAISHALSDRKTLLPTDGDTLAAQIVGRALTRAHRAALRAVAAEMRTMAEEMEREADAA